MDLRRLPGAQRRVVMHDPVNLESAHPAEFQITPSGRNRHGLIALFTYHASLLSHYFPRFFFLLLFILVLLLLILLFISLSFCCSFSSFLLVVVIKAHFYF